MDIQAYISSGVLESYVLGELTPSEAQQVEEMAARYPEVREELQLIELTLDSVLHAAAVAPPADVRTAVLNMLPQQAELEKKPVTEAPVRQLHSPEAKAPDLQYQRWLTAASLGLAVVSSLAAVYFWSRWQETEDQIASLLTQNTVLVQHVSTLENRTAEIEQSLAVFTDPAFKAVPLKGLEPAPNAQAVVYWNPATAQAFLNPGSLPKAPAGKQYQLWAIVDGKPVNAGVFDTTGTLIKAIQDIPKASAFAITLEPQGGSPSPTLEQMYVIGETS